MQHAWRTQSPGKAIIFGEFAVLWGYESIVIPLSEGILIEWRHEKSQNNVVLLDDFRYRWDEIRAEASKVQERYARYLKRELDAGDIIEHRDQLSLVCLSYASDELQRGQLSLRRSSSLYEGSGLGSSAALITALLKGLNIKKNLYQLSCSIESYQHGQSSGVDIFVALTAQATRYCQGQQKYLTDSLPQVSLLHTGIPLSNTAQSVALAQKNMTQALRASYPQKAIMQALKSGHEAKWLTALRLNHRWLCELGVVPQKVADFIAAVEALGGAAKISGAGSISGEQAGAVIAWPHPEIEKLAKYYGYTFKENCSWNFQAQPMAQ